MEIHCHKQCHSLCTERILEISICDSNLNKIIDYEVDLDTDNTHALLYNVEHY